MNYRMVFKRVGTLLCLEAACMVPSLVVAVIYGQGDAMAFVISILITLVIGILLSLIKPRSADLYARDGLAMVGFGWIAVWFCGILPFLFSGAIPSVIDALFETISGFTTTGATILTNVEALPHGILFWRSFTHFMGGIGFLILMLALLPKVRANTVHIMNAESPGPAKDKFAPRIRQIAKWLYIIYISITAIEVVFLLAGGMNLFDALIHAFGTAGTGGFSDYNASVAAFGSLYIENVITIFMILFGINFTLYHELIRGKLKSVLHNEELRMYLGTIVIAILLITLNTTGTFYKNFGQALRYASFQVSSIITTTGFATTNFAAWPTFSQGILLLLMLFGAMAGSTGGGLKSVRTLLLFKIARREIGRRVHPRAVRPVKLNGQTVDESMLSGVTVFFFLYITIFIIATLIVLLDGFDIVTSASAVLSALSNIGPGLGQASVSFAEFSGISKITMSLCMILGRLEIYPVLLLCVPSFWKRRD